MGDFPAAVKNGYIFVESRLRGWQAARSAVKRVWEFTPGKVFCVGMAAAMYTQKVTLTLSEITKNAPPPRQLIAGLGVRLRIVKANGITIGFWETIDFFLSLSVNQIVKYKFFRDRPCRVSRPDNRHKIIAARQGIPFDVIVPDSEEHIRCPFIHIVQMILQSDVLFQFTKQDSFSSLRYASRICPNLPNGEPGML